MADVTKLAVLDTGETLYRLRVGERRACYAVITSDREVWMLIFEDRELGFRRLIKTATARFRSVP